MYNQYKWMYNIFLSLKNNRKVIQNTKLQFYLVYLAILLFLLKLVIIFEFLLKKNVLLIYVLNIFIFI